MTVGNYSGIEGKRIFITGSTTGLGLSMATALAQAKARVSITGRDQALVDSVVRSFKESNLDGIGCVLDVRSEKSISDTLDKLLGQWGGIDILINNAGIGMRTVHPQFMSDPLPFWRVPSEKFKDLIETNLTGYFLAAKSVAPYFLKQGQGRIINISMNHETMRRKGFVPYGPSRAATESLSQIMAEDFRSHGIRVNMLLPGAATSTDMIPEPIPADIRAQLLAPDIMAEPILFLCSREAQDVHNERIVAKDFKQWLSSRV